MEREKLFDSIENFIHQHEISKRNAEGQLSLGIAAFLTILLYVYVNMGNPTKYMEKLYEGIINLELTLYYTGINLIIVFFVFVLTERLFRRGFHILVIRHTRDLMYRYALHNRNYEETVFSFLSAPYEFIKTHISSCQRLHFWIAERCVSSSIGIILLLLALAILIAQKIIRDGITAIF